MFKSLSLLSNILRRKFGIPEINLNKNPLTRKLINDITEDEFKKVLKELPKENLLQIIKIAQEIAKDK
jgi:hypothetical protein